MVEIYHFSTNLCNGTKNVYFKQLTNKRYERRQKY